MLECLVDSDYGEHVTDSNENLTEQLVVLIAGCHEKCKDGTVAISMSLIWGVIE